VQVFMFSTPAFLARQALDRLRGACSSVLQSSVGVAPEQIHVLPTGLSLDG
jgi:hypothetical protein